MKGIVNKTGILKNFFTVLVTMTVLTLSYSSIYLANAKTQRPAALSEESAAAFVGFILNDGSLTKDEIQDMDLYKLLTGEYDGDDEKERLMMLSWFIRSTTFAHQEDSDANKAYLTNALVEYLEKNTGSTMDKQIIGKMQSKASGKFIDGICDMVDGQYFSNNDMLDASSIYNAYNTAKGTAAKAEAMYDAIIAATESYFLVIDSDRNGRYSYFNYYLAIRPNYSSADDETFQLLLSNAELTYKETNFLAILIDSFSWLTGKDSFMNHTDTIETWAEYVYQLEQYADKLPATESYFKDESTDKDDSVQEALVTFEQDALTYAIISDKQFDKRVEVYSCRPDVTDIAIPSTVYREVSVSEEEEETGETQIVEYQVTGIHERAFYASNVERVTLPDTITRIGASAFKFTPLSSINIPVGIESIGDGSFSHCKLLKSIILPDGLDSVGAYAFSNCTGLSDITIPKNVSVIGSYAFRQCTGLCSAVLPADITSIPSGLFYKCTALSTVSIPDGVLQINGDAFAYTALTNVTIPSSVDYIYSGAFGYCRKLKNVSLSEGVKEINGAFYYCTSLDTVDLPATLIRIGSESFLGCTNLQNIIIPDGVIEIGERAFESCGLTSVIIPKNVENILDKAFCSCTDLEVITLSDGIGIAKTHEETVGVADNAYINSGIRTLNIASDAAEVNAKMTNGLESLVKTVVISDGVKKIASHAFEGFGLLQTIIIPDSIIEVSESAYTDCEITELIIADGSETVNSSMTHLLEKVDTVLLPDTLVLIDDSAFIDFSQIQNITIPHSVEHIGSYAFSNCDSLESIVIPDNVVTIGNSVFQACNTLQEVHIGTALSEISQYAFAECTSLGEIEFPENITAIAEYAFSGCTSFVQIHIPGNIKDVASYSFSHCTGVTDIILDEGIERMGVSVFYGCDAAENLIVAFGNLTVVSDEDAYFCQAFDKDYGAPGIKNVTISGGDSVPNNAFAGYSYFTSNEGFSNIQTVVMADTVKYIGVGAFYWCLSLENVTFSKHLEEIQYCAFHYCKNLKTVVLPDSIKYIASSSFSFCVALEKMSVPFGGRDKSGVYTAEENMLQKMFDIPQECVHFEEDKEKCCYSIPRSLKSIEVRNTDSIDDYAFAYFSCVENIIFPQNITCIGNKAFYMCESAAELQIPSTVTSIGALAFYGCKSIESVVIPDGVTTIKEGVFENCTALKSVTVHDGITATDETAFSGCNVEELIITDDSESVSPVMTFPSSFASTLKTAVIPDSVICIEANSFYQFTELESVQFPNSTFSIGEKAFFSSGLITVEIVGNITNIGDEAFYGCTELRSYTAGKIETIGSRAFGDCPALSSLILPNGLKTIEEEAFYFCGMTELVVPDSVTSMGLDMLFGCTKLKNLVLPYASTTAEYSKTGGSDEYSQVYDLFDSGKVAYSGTLEYSPLTIKITGGKWIPVNAFNGMKFIEKVILNDGITDIGEKSFYNCPNIISVTMPDGVISIGDYAFQHCTGMQTFRVPDSVTYIGNGMLDGCLSLNYLTIPYASRKPEFAEEINYTDRDSTAYNINSIIGIDSDCKHISMTIEVTGGKWIPEKAFQNNKFIKNVILPDGLTGIGKYAFSQCGGLESITLPTSVTTIGDGAFKQCTSLKSITLPTSVTTMGDGAFKQCTSLKSIQIPERVTEINEESFYGCSALKTVQFPDNLNRIGTYAFKDCVSLVNISVSDTLALIDEGAFQCCTGLERVILSEGVKVIRASAFEGCTNLRYIEIPESVTEIDSDILNDCSGLEEVSLPYIGYTNGLTISDFLGGDLSNLKRITIRSGSCVPEYAFDSLPVEEIILPDELVTIEKYAFRNCTNLKELVIPDSVLSYDNSMLEGCYSLTHLVLPYVTSTFRSCCATIDLGQKEKKVER